jgi:hypothetical protein
LISIVIKFIISAVIPKPLRRLGFDEPESGPLDSLSPPTLWHKSGRHYKGQRPVSAEGLLQPQHFLAATFRGRPVRWGSREGVALRTDINLLLILRGLFLFSFLLTTTAAIAHDSSPFSLV